MQSDPSCLGCGEMGRLVGRDDWGRGLFACSTERCDVVEYDRDVIRMREGLVADRVIRRPRRRGEPAYWARRAG
jgi:hypothetical protein